MQGYEDGRRVAPHQGSCVKYCYGLCHAERSVVDAADVALMVLRKVMVYDWTCCRFACALNHSKSEAVDDVAPECAREKDDVDVVRVAWTQWHITGVL